MQLNWKHSYSTVEYPYTRISFSLRRILPPPTHSTFKQAVSKDPVSLSKISAKKIKCNHVDSRFTVK